MTAGISTVCGGLAEIARGYGEAGRALRHAAPVAGTLHAYAQCDLNVARTAERSGCTRTPSTTGYGAFTNSPVATRGVLPISSN